MLSFRACCLWVRRCECCVCG